MDLLSPQCAAQSVGALNQLVSTMVHSILTAHCAISPPEIWPNDFGPTAIRDGSLIDYDFIVVGSGSAGSVVANRLSKTPNWKVLVLEAGGNPPAESVVPFTFVTLQSSSMDWNFTAEISEKYGTGILNGVNYNRGKCIGGSGEMNAMFYIRGNRRDYDSWEAAGNPGWGWNNVLKYFKKSEKMLDRDIANSDHMEYHGSTGPWTIGGFEKHDDQLKKIVVKALGEYGIPKVLDFNGDVNMGVGDSSGNLWRGVRQSPGRSFLSTIKHRSNLHIIKHAHVTKLKIDESGHVEGVEFYLRGHKMMARAKKEYILSAGALNSPQILMLSGIGPSSQLKNFGIEPKIDVEVGRNFHDHPITFLMFKYPTNETPSDHKLLYAYFQYLLEKQGIFSTSPVSDLMLFMNTKNQSAQYPDVQIHHSFFERGDVQGIRDYLTLFGFGERYTESVVKEIKHSSVLYMIVTLLNPKSRGHLQLRSSNPHHKIRIFPNFFDHPDDIDTLRNAIRFLQTLVKTKTFRQHGVELVVNDIRQCRHFRQNSDEFWNCYIRYASAALYHPCCTTKMGPESDPQAVVDHRLKVYGTDNLRVVDGSVMPTIPSGNTQAPIVMVAEKASDSIRRAWNAKA